MFKSPSSWVAKALIGAALGALAVFVFWFDLGDRGFLETLIHENGWTENLTVLLLLWALVLLVVAAVREKSALARLWFAGYAALCLVIAGEELSWGQQITRSITPDWMMRLNVQKETNLHNIPGLHMVELGFVILAGLFLVLPFASRLFPWVQRLLEKLRFPVLPLGWVGIPLFILAVKLLARALGLMDYYTDEVVETAVAVLFAVFAWDRFAASRRM